MLTSLLHGIVENEVRKGLNDILPYVTEDVNFDLILSIGVDDSLKTSVNTNKNNSQFEEIPIIELNIESSDAYLLVQAEKSTPNFIVGGGNQKGFLQKGIHYP